MDNIRGAKIVEADTSVDDVMVRTRRRNAIVSILVSAQLLGIATYADLGDTCDYPIAISLGQEYQASTEGATGTDISSCGNDDAYDVWHSFIPGFSDEYMVSLCGSSFDTTLAVFDACTGNQIACADDWEDCGAQSQLTVYLKVGETYLIRVAGNAGETGDYVLLVMDVSNRVTDGFETGSFSALPWQDQETRWRITLDTSYTGLSSARSGLISDDQRSILTLTHDCKAGDIGFAVRISSEQNHDGLIFGIDGQEIDAWSGEMDWIHVNYPVAAGPHTFTWSYEKDGSGSANEDAAWIDDVVFTDLEVPEEPNGPELPEGPVDMDFVDVPAGIFEMGDHFNEGWYDERPVHPVILDSFRISKYETTNAQYAEYLNAALAGGRIQVAGGVVYDAADSNQSEPYFDTHSASEDSQIEYGQGQFTVRSRDGYSMADHPVVKVSWYGANAFCEYYGYRLPTEAEWEYSARGGYHNPYYRYPWGSNALDENMANYDFHNPLGLTSFPCTTPVGTYGPQGTYGDGLCDMAGNVLEWCQDRHNSYGTGESPVRNPLGSSSVDYRILRGGSWFHRPKYCRTADRNRYAPFHRSRYSGFRVCVSVSAPD